MINQEPTYELSNGKDLDKFLLGAIRDVRLKKLTIDEGNTLSKLADSYTKRRLQECVERKLKMEEQQFNWEKEKVKQLNKSKDEA